jgi:hypothetical protein
MPPFGTSGGAMARARLHVIVAREILMKFQLSAIALLLASGAAQAQSDRAQVRNGCDVHSQYSVSPYRDAFLFKSEAGKPAEIGIGGGRLFVDGKEATLSAADHDRLVRMETEMKALVPEVEKVSLEAIDIAFTALVEVARGLSSTPDKTVANLQDAQRRVRGELRGKPLAVFNEDAIEGIIEPIITRFVPDIAGGAVSAALKAAFSGEAEAKKFEARMQRMEAELDTRVEARAKALEPLALAMCDRLVRMDALDDALEYRLPSGDALQLLRIDARHPKD